MKNTSFIIGLIILIAVVGVGAYIYTHRSNVAVTPSEQMATTTPSTATTTPIGEPSAIGKSVEGRDISAYHYGTGSTELLFVGGIHGGYEWNTVLLAFNLMDYLKAHPEAIPANESVTVIPVLNPDGLNKVVGTTGRFTAADVPSAAQTIPGRFNGNNVDLNRNFDCDWKANGVWQNKSVSGGTAAFSEPETQALKAYSEANKLAAVVALYSSAGGVFSSNCHAGVPAETAAITKIYAKASGYKAYEDFNFYDITGDMVNWFAKQGTPAISIVLTTHTDTEWDKNLAGVKALLAHYAQ
jgi:hypothetical protein